MKLLLIGILSLGSISTFAQSDESSFIASDVQDLSLNQIREIFSEAKEPWFVNYFYSRYKCKTILANVKNPVMGNEEFSLQFKGTKKNPIFLQPGSTGSGELVLSLNGNELIGSGKYANTSGSYYLAFRETSDGKLISEFSVTGPSSEGYDIAPKPISFSKGRAISYEFCTPF